MPPAARSASLEALPDPLLGRIFAAAGQEAGAAITLVSRRWHRVFYSEPDLWRSLELTAESLDAAYAEGKARQWFAARANLLRRVGRFVQHLSHSEALEDFDDDMLEVDDSDEGQQVKLQQLAAASGSQWRLGSSVLAHLSPAALQSLSLEWPTLVAAAAAALARLSSLTQLQIDCGDQQPRYLLASLASVPQLQCLELRSDVSLPEGLPTELQPLTQLTSLTCESDGSLPELSVLWPLTRLRNLKWQEEREDGVRHADVQQLLARRPHLETWSLFSALIWGGGMQIGGALLERCAVEGCNRADGAAQVLELARIRQLPSLRQLVAAALPAGTQPSQLCSLRILHSPLPLHAVLSCPFLGHLTGLQLRHSSLSDEGELTGVEALLQQAPRLQSLTLLGCLRRPPLPPALIRLTGLQHLRLGYSALPELPWGPYLSRLLTLELVRTSFSRVPPALSTATSLRELSLTDNPQLVLSIEDVLSVLMRLPRLQHLYLDVERTQEHVSALLAHAMPQLQIHDGHAPWD